LKGTFAARKANHARMVQLEAFKVPPYKVAISDIGTQITLVVFHKL
jgi:hypothetical protein